MMLNHVLYGIVKLLSSKAFCGCGGVLCVYVCMCVCVCVYGCEAISRHAGAVKRLLLLF